MNEIWKAIKGYEGKYEVSNYGRIKSLERTNRVGSIIKSKILNPKAQKNGYIRVHLSTGNGYRSEAVHRLVAEAFVERKSEYDDIVNHLDNNPRNNRADNLEWTTYKGNMQWAAKQGRMHFSSGNLAKAQESKKVPVIAIDQNGNRTRFESQRDAEKVLGVSASHIAAICRKEYGYKHSKGYEFEYADEEYQKTLKPNKVGKSKDELNTEKRERMRGNQYGKGKKPSEKNKLASRQKLGKPICQYDIHENFIREFPCCIDVEREIGIFHTGAVANGKRKTAGGYIWRWKEK